MGHAWTIVLPLALGAAVSPTLLTLELLVLAGARDQKKRAWALCAGSALTLLVYMALLATVARGLDLASGHQGDAERAVKLLAALLLLLLGVRSLRHRHDPPKPRNPKLQEAKPGLFFGVGAAAMLGNLSSLVLVLPATHITVTSGLPPDQVALMLAIVFVITLTPVWLPVLAASVFGHRADPVLASMNRFTTTHTHQINAGIAFFFTALLVLSALR